MPHFPLQGYFEQFWASSIFKEECITDYFFCGLIKISSPEMRLKFIKCWRQLCGAIISLIGLWNSLQFNLSEYSSCNSSLRPCNRVVLKGRFYIHPEAKKSTNCFQLTKLAGLLSSFDDSQNPKEMAQTSLLSPIIELYAISQIKYLSRRSFVRIPQYRKKSVNRTSCHGGWFTWKYLTSSKEKNKCFFAILFLLIAPQQMASERISH